MNVRPPIGTQELNLEVNRSLITLTPSCTGVLEGEALPLNVASLITQEEGP